MVPYWLQHAIYTCSLDRRRFDDVPLWQPTWSCIPSTIWPKSRIRPSWRRDPQALPGRALNTQHYRHVCVSGCMQRRVLLLLLLGGRSSNPLTDLRGLVLLSHHVAVQDKFQMIHLFITGRILTGGRGWSTISCQWRALNKLLLT